VRSQAYNPARQWLELAKGARLPQAGTILKRMDRRGGGRVKLGGGNAHERAVG